MAQLNWTNFTQPNLSIITFSFPMMCYITFFVQKYTENHCTAASLLMCVPLNERDHCWLAITTLRRVRKSRLRYFLLHCYLASHKNGHPLLQTSDVLYLSMNEGSESLEKSGFTNGVNLMLCPSSEMPQPKVPISCPLIENNSCRITHAFSL